MVEAQLPPGFITRNQNKRGREFRHAMVVKKVSSPSTRENPLGHASSISEKNKNGSFWAHSDEL